MKTVNFATVVFLMAAGTVFGQIGNPKANYNLQRMQDFADRIFEEQDAAEGRRILRLTSLVEWHEFRGKGNYKFNAKFIEFNNGRATLYLEDGKLVEVRPVSFHKDDLKFITAERKRWADLKKEHEASEKKKTTSPRKKNDGSVRLLERDGRDKITRWS